jgi:small-conductance mechanosensitive channel
MSPAWMPLANVPPAAGEYSLGTQLVMLLIPTLLFGLYLGLLAWGRRLMLGWITRRLATHMQRVDSAHLRRVSLRQFLLIARLGVRLLGLALLVAGALAWLTAVLDVMPATHQWALHIEQTMLDELALLARGVLVAIPGLAMVAVIYFLARSAHEMIGHYFSLIESGEVQSDTWDAVTAQTTRRLAGVGIWVAAAIVAYPYIPGSGTSAFKGVTILAGLMLSLGSTNLVGQLINGLVLIYSRAVRPGEVVVVDQTEGVLEKVGLFSCALRTANDELVWLPNSALAAGVRNNSRPAPGGSVRFTTQVTIGYDTPWRQVRDLLLAAAAATSAVRKDPAPFVRQVALEDFYVRYELVFAPADPAQRKVVLTELHQAIQDNFHGAGVQIMSPNYRGDPAQPKIPPPAPRQ